MKELDERGVGVKFLIKVGLLVTDHAYNNILHSCTSCFMWDRSPALLTFSSPPSCALFACSLESLRRLVEQPSGIAGFPAGSHLSSSCREKSLEFARCCSDKSWCYLCPSLRPDLSSYLSREGQPHVSLPVCRVLFPHVFLSLMSLTHFELTPYLPPTSELSAILLAPSTLRQE